MLAIITDFPYNVIKYRIDLFFLPLSLVKQNFTKLDKNMLVYLLNNSIYKSNYPTNIKSIKAGIPNLSENFSAMIQNKIIKAITNINWLIYLPLPITLL